MTKSDRFLDRLRSLGFAIAADARIERTYPTSREQREGAWLWRVPLTTGPDSPSLFLGSIYPVAELAGRRLAASGHHNASWAVLTHVPGDYPTPSFLVEPRVTTRAHAV